MPLDMPNPQSFTYFKTTKLIVELTLFSQKKTRSSPNKEKGIPILESLAALIGKRCIQFVEIELKIHKSKTDVGRLTVRTDLDK